MPHMAITGAIMLAVLCVAMLIFFVNHVASRINFDTVIELVYQDLNGRLERLESYYAEAANESDWDGGLSVIFEGTGYIQQLDEEQLADWAQEHGVILRLNARIGDFVFPGAPLACVKPGIADASRALRQSVVLGAYPTPSGDLEYTIEQLVDIAVRALSSGVNDPRTANRILDRLGAALCVIAAKQLPTGAFVRDNRVVFQKNTTTYDGLLDAMFHIIRQSAQGNVTVLIHMADILIKVAQCESAPDRRTALRRHADLLTAQGNRSIVDPGDVRDLQERMKVLNRELQARA